ncbi:alkylation response protein AidB-like acyl-CoA dehydrogenase [Streptacidiphilus sp. MAP12-33]|uniref:acyl-CoA dehydrogenase n=1 Tax=Streptacidiphilus sp. MAP12-33 TaxID=3156266 RepID=UPI003513828D
MTTTAHTPGAAAAAPDAEARVAAVEAAFGDPWDPENPVGHAALLAADADRRVLPEAERALDRFGLGAELVPTALGGRMDRVDTVARVLRHVFRRDASVGVGHALMSLMASVHVWNAGTELQRQETARLLLGGGRMTNAYHEVAHSNLLLRDEYEAWPRGSGYLLSGRKRVIFNGTRADALTLVCRTGGTGLRSHSVLLVRREGLDPSAVSELPRQETLGVRSCHTAGLGFRACFVDRSALLGAEGDGVELSLRSFQVVRAVAASAVIGVADTALRTAVRTALASGQTRERPWQTLTGGFADLLLCDAFALAGTRATHLLPGRTSVYAAAVKYLVPRVLTQTLNDLSSVLGEHLFDREGESGFFQKTVRDLPVVSLGHSGSAACQATLVPQLRRLASGWLRTAPAPQRLFRPHGDLPGLPGAERLLLAAPDDPVASWLDLAPEGPLRPLAAALRAEFEELRARCLELPADVTDLRAFPLTDRYALLLAGAAVVAVHTACAEGPSGAGDAFLADPAWAALALTRIARRLELPVPDPAPEWSETLRRELHDRYTLPRSFDLYATPVAG